MPTLTNTAPPAPLKILIVDDSEDMRELLKITFNQDKYQLFEAKDGQEGLTMATHIKPDVMLLDIKMPGHFDGLTVCDAIKNSELKNICVILLTAKNQQADFQEGFELGADAYATKPFIPNELIALVEKMAVQQPLDYKNSVLLRSQFWQRWSISVVLCILLAVGIGIYSTSIFAITLSYCLLSIIVTALIMHRIYTKPTRTKH